MDDVLQLDDNLSNGHTYTFILQLKNWITSPSDAVIQDDIVANAPDFITSLQVTHQERFFSQDNYNIQFTYEGDGSDVVSDLASALVAAIQVGSNDNFVFVQAIGAPASAVASQAIQVVQSAGGVLTQAGTEVGKAAGQITSGALGGATQGLGAWLIPVILVLAVVLLFQLGGIGGVRKSLQGA
jgi:hypothetical protein